MLYLRYIHTLNKALVDVFKLFDCNGFINIYIFL
jgi:hypothetical protein